MAWDFFTEPEPEFEEKLEWIRRFRAERVDPLDALIAYDGVRVPGDALSMADLEMDPPEQRHYRQALNPYLSPAAVSRWIPVVDEVVRAAIGEKIEEGRIDFVDDLANVVPAVLTLAMMGIPLKDWTVYNEPAHASVYTPPNSPDMKRVAEMARNMGIGLATAIAEIRANPRPGLVDALIHADINGRTPPDSELLGVLTLLIGGGFDTTTALTAHALEWLGENPAERDRLSRERDTLLDSATEEFLRYFAPAPGDGRTFSADCEIAGARFKEGEQLWLSWAMANRDPSVRMVTQVLDRMPDYQCDPEGTVHYETIGIIQGMRHLPATFTPGPRFGAGLDETLEKLQQVCDEQRIAEPVTVRKGKAQIST